MKSKRAACLILLLALLAGCGSMNSPPPEATEKPAREPVDNGRPLIARAVEAAPGDGLTFSPDKIEAFLTNDNMEASSPEIDPLHLSPNQKSAFDARELVADGCYLGDSRITVESQMGKPAMIRMTEDEDYYWTEYHYSKDTVFRFSAYAPDAPFILRGVSVSDPMIRGPRGMRVGDTLEKLLSSFMIRDIELTEEQYKRLIPSHEHPESLLYATVYDVETFPVGSEEEPYTVVLKPWAYIETVSGEGESYLRVVYVDVMPYDPFGMMESIPSEQNTSRLSFEIKKGLITRFEWFSTV